MPNFLPDLKRKDAEIIYSKICKSCGEITNNGHACQFSTYNFDRSKMKIKRSGDIRLKSRSLNHLLLVLRQFIKELVDLHMNGPQKVQTPLCVYNSVMSGNQSVRSNLLALLFTQI